MTASLFVAIRMAICIAVVVWTIGDRLLRADATQLAARLAERGIPAGVVFPSDDIGSPRDAGRYLLPRSPSRDDVRGWISEFNAQKSRFKASENQGVIHLRPFDEPAAIREFLEQPLVLDPVTNITPFDAVFRRLVGAVLGRAPDGISGTGLEPPRSCQLERRIALPGGSTSVIGSLDELVRQAPGLGWIATYDDSLLVQSLKVGILCPDGSTQMTQLYH